VIYICTYIYIDRERERDLAVEACSSAQVECFAEGLPVRRMYTSQKQHILNTKLAALTMYIASISFLGFLFKQVKLVVVVATLPLL